jgi:hypothetical protein
MPNTNLKKTEEIIDDGLKSVETIVSDTIDLTVPQTGSTDTNIAADSIEIPVTKVTNGTTPADNTPPDEIVPEEVIPTPPDEVVPPVEVTPPDAVDNKTAIDKKAIDTIKSIISKIDYSYVNSFDFLNEKKGGNFSVENIEKFYRSFKAWGPRSRFDFEILKQCEILLPAIKQSKK